MREKLNMSLIEIIKSRNMRLAEWILKEYTPDSEYNVSVNLHDKWGETTFIWACDRGHLEIAELLLSRQDLDINLQVDGGWTALMDACWRGDLEIVELLLKREKLDVNLQNKRGVTALDIAYDRGHRDIVELLERFGAV